MCHVKDCKVTPYEWEILNLISHEKELVQKFHRVKLNNKVAKDNNLK